MDRSWIYLQDRSCNQYSNGVDNFIEVAKNYLNREGKTRCPCKNCLNVIWNKLDDVERHLFKYGMPNTYSQWTFHGDKVDLSPFLRSKARVLGATFSHSAECREDDGNLRAHVRDKNIVDDEMLEMLNDLHAPIFEDIPRESNEQDETCRFSGMFDKVEEELYPGCLKFTSFNFLVKLMHIKVLNHWSDKSFNMLLDLLKEAFPEGVRLPTSYYEAKKRLRDLGMGYESIDACKFDCALFWKQYASLDHCPHCGESRYKLNNENGKKIPHKVLRYFPLKTRLQRLYLSKHNAQDIRWHKDKRCDTEGILKHPADAEGWKHFDSQYPCFAADARNVRLTLSSDGFNPFGNMSLSYSLWPVMLIPYNLPPWKCMKQPFIFLSLLIPGPRSPGKEIDIYLQPLVDELNELWVNGVRTVDSFSSSFFQLRAALLWTINDFPAYGDLSGWTTKGYKACPVCNVDTSSRGLKSKICYMGHRRYLSLRHAWRKSLQHDGEEEMRPAPKMLTGKDIINQLNSLSFPMLSKNPTLKDKKGKKVVNEHKWTKRSIFFNLSYWENLLLRHKLDVMHIEKNICDNLVGTILNIDGKTKDTIKAREDLAEMEIREELHIQEIGKRRFKPHASYTLTADEKDCSTHTGNWKKTVQFNRSH